MAKKSSTTVQEQRYYRWAMLVFRLMTEPRGVPLDDLQREFGIADRTWRKDRSEFRGAFEPFLDRSTGEPLVEEVTHGDSDRVYMRLKPGYLDKGPSSQGFRARITAMLMIREMMGFVSGTPLGEEIEQIIEELEGSISNAVAFKHLRRDGDRKLHVVEEAPVNFGQESNEIIEQLLQATLNEERIRIEYTSGLAGQQRTNTFELEPLSLVSCRGALYLMGRRLTVKNIDLDPPAEEYARDVRTFSIQRIDSVELTGESFDYPRRGQFDPDTFFDGHFGIYQRRDRARKVDVELIFKGSPWLKVYLQERTFHPTQRFEDLGEEGLKMRMTVSSMERVWPWIRSFGDDIEVLQPKGKIPMTMDEQRAWEKKWRDEYD